MARRIDRLAEDHGRFMRVDRECGAMGGAFGALGMGCATLKWYAEVAGRVIGCIA
jgi:hypothetical protein